MRSSSYKCLAVRRSLDLGIEDQEEHSGERRPVGSALSKAESTLGGVSSPRGLDNQACISCGQ